ncbi:HPr family phosphocarrier protein [Rhodococcus koreensis]
MPHRRATIGSAQGLHARPAAVFTQAAAAVGHPVTIGRVGQDPVMAASALMVMSLGLSQGEQVELVVDDAAPTGTIDELTALLEADLDAAS